MKIDSIAMFIQYFGTKDTRHYVKSVKMDEKNGLCTIEMGYDE